MFLRNSVSKSLKILKLKNTHQNDKYLVSWFKNIAHLLEDCFISIKRQIKLGIIIFFFFYTLKSINV